MTRDSHKVPNKCKGSRHGSMNPGVSLTPTSQSPSVPVLGIVESNSSIAITAHDELINTSVPVVGIDPLSLSIPIAGSDDLTNPSDPVVETVESHDIPATAARVMDIKDSGVMHNTPDYFQTVAYSLSGVHEVFAILNNEEVMPISDRATTRELFDTGCSFNVTGNKTRLTNPMSDESTSFAGFNNSASRTATIGDNPDKLKEYYVPGMDPSTTLLCAQTYAQLGGVILFKNKGFVLQLTEAHQKHVEQQLTLYPVTKELKVENNIYIVNSKGSAKLAMPDTDTVHQVYSSVGQRFFQNVKVQTTDNFELILSYLMCGFTIQGLEDMVSSKAVNGLNPKLTVPGIREFRKQHGDRPAMIGRGIVRSVPTHKGLRDTRIVPTKPGDRVEFDVAFPKFNVPKTADNPSGEKKISSVGGAQGFAMSVDAASNYNHVFFLQTFKHPVVPIRMLLNRYDTQGVKIKLLATDQGMNPDSSTIQNTVVKYLDSKRVETEVAVPYDHNSGTARVESGIGSVKDLVDIAYTYIKTSPHVKSLGFDTMTILYRLWGDLTNWAIDILNLRMCPSDPTKTCYEVFLKRRPNTQDMRILPILSVVLMWRPSGFDKFTTKPSMQPALYVGASKASLGAIRVAYMKEGHLQVVVTNNYTSPSDGGSLNLHEVVERGYHNLIPSAYTLGENSVDFVSEEEDNLIHKNNPLYNDFRIHYNKQSPVHSTQEMLLEQAIPAVQENIIMAKVVYHDKPLKIKNMIPFGDIHNDATNSIPDDGFVAPTDSVPSSELELLPPPSVPPMGHEVVQDRSVPDAGVVEDPDKVSVMHRDSTIPPVSTPESRGEKHMERDKYESPKRNRKWKKEEVSKKANKPIKNKPNVLEPIERGSSPRRGYKGQPRKYKVPPPIAPRTKYPRMVKKSREEITDSGNKKIREHIANVSTKITDYFKKKEQVPVTTTKKEVWWLDGEEEVISPTQNEIKDVNQYVTDYKEIKEMATLKTEAEGILRNLTDRKVAADTYYKEEYLNGEDYEFQTKDDLQEVHILTTKEAIDFKNSIKDIDHDMDSLIRRKEQQQEHVASLKNMSKKLLLDTVRIKGAAHVQKHFKEVKAKGSGVLKVTKALYDTNHLRVVASKSIKEPSSSKDTLCTFSDDVGVPLEQLKTNQNFNTDYAFSNLKMDKAFLPGGQHMGGLLDDAFDDELNNCRFVITRNNRLEIINVRPIEEGEEVCVAYGRDYWLHFAEHNDITDDLRKKIEDYYQATLPRKGSVIQQVANMTDWTTHKADDMYYNFLDNHVVQFIETEEERQRLKLSDPNIVWDEHEDYSGIHGTVHTAFEVIKDGIPRNFQEALTHPLWGAGARLEWNTLQETKSLAKVDSRGAKEAVANKEADVVYLFPIYEKKIKEGEVVYRVRLVGNGKTHNPTINTYAATPSREEFLILMHLAATNDYEIAHVDEKRAFLSADKVDTRQVYARLRGDGNFYSVLKALYGLKTSPADYQANVIRRFKSMGYKRLGMCQCIFYKEDSDGENKCIIYAYVDDFVFTGTSRAYMEAQIDQLMENASVTPPIWNEMTLLGMDIKRNRKKRTILVTMSEKIKRLYADVYAAATDQDIKRKGHPMPVAGYKVMDEDFKDDDPTSEFLDTKGIQEYMTLVGCLVWIMGIRFDCTFVITYFTWFTNKPRVHHMNMVLHCIQYLHTTAHLPLVLGGTDDLEVLGFSDSSLGTAPKRRSPLGQCIRLGRYSGCIHAKTSASSMTYLNIFEGELDSTCILFKSMHRVINELHEFCSVGHTAKAFGDNLAVVEFIQGRGFPKGVRHMQLRMWYVREQYLAGVIDLDHMAGAILTADYLTKVADAASHGIFTIDILGLRLLGLKSLVGSEHEIIDYLQS